MQITRVTCPENKYSTKCPDKTVMEGITVHNTANDASAMAEVSYMIGRTDKVSFHAAVDDYRVVEGLPFDRSCYAAGDGRYGFGNAKTINIEICYSKSGGDRFTAAEKLAAEYIAYLLKKYNWGIDKVGTHQMRSGKYCPHRTLDLGWERFLNLIKLYCADLRYKSHIQDIGWTDWKNAGEVSGTEGQAKRVEAIILEGHNGLDISYRVHMENIGWSDWKANGEIAGTEGQERRIEAIEIKSNKMLEVQEHVQNVGWLPSSKGTEIRVGTVGKALRLEAFKINVIG